MYPGCDYYEIELCQYKESMHPDLPPTTLRGYRHANTEDQNVSKFSYLGPLIIANNGTPVRVKFTNKLPTDAEGDLFIPVEHTAMGAGMGPLGMNTTPMNYTENKAVIHLHGGFVPWISDGSPHMWTTPAGEHTAYPKGVSVYNVPDMDNGQEPPGTLTFYYNNEQSARLMFYHDHAWGVTRLNVYAGEARGYLFNGQRRAGYDKGDKCNGRQSGLAAGAAGHRHAPARTARWIQEPSGQSSEPDQPPDQLRLGVGCTIATSWATKRMT